MGHALRTPSYPVPSFHFLSECQEEQSPFWNEAHNDWDYTDQANQPAENPPPLNGFVFTAAYDAQSQVLRLWMSTACEPWVILTRRT